MQIATAEWATVLAVMAALAACGTDEREMNQSRDAAQSDDGLIARDAALDDTAVDAMMDAGNAGPTVVAVTCAGTLPTVTTSNGTTAYMPSTTTISQGDVVKFVMSSKHDVTPDATGSDPGLVVAKGQTKCLKFTATGTFGFHCSAHATMGSIVVQ